ncbi:MAG: glucuronate isomerase [Treponema sp.]|jgi:glucuronate isomerase|nr:glucuronate isomerase [Treponema sp.]
MKKFIDKNFLLSTKTAQKLYLVAAAEPIFDYHCHLIPQEIAENRRFPDLATVWLGGDHYKWRAMRSNGINERFITGKTGGDAEPYDKFLAWAETVPRLIGNPLYHWTHLELQRYFDISEPLNPQSAPAIWKAANERLANDPSLSVFGIFKKFNVYAVGTTDDPADSLEWHEKAQASYKQGASTAKVMPSFRPDRIINIEKPDFAEYIAKLAAGKNVNNFDDLLGVIKDRIAFFHDRGCRISDHGLDSVPFATASGDPRLARPAEINFSQWEHETKTVFAQAMNGQKPNAVETESWKTFIFNFLGEEYAVRNWAMQIHIAAIRNNNSAAFAAFGPDSGFDAAHDQPITEKLARLLDLLFSRGKLPKTILYSLNLKDLYPLATLMGCFQGEIVPAQQTIPGKIQLGSGWWFLDHIDGMEAQMRLLGNTSLLSRFVGMLTDSRSFLSYPRHEYFRRILCNILGTWAENGEIPNDFELLGNMVRDISFRNARRYFEIDIGNW